MGADVRFTARAEVMLADAYGFCGGVRRAVEIARETRRRTSGRVSTLGPLVHNPDVLRELECEGVDADGAEGIAPGDTVIVSAHGAAPEPIAALARQGARVVDATCPFVRRLHAAAAAVVAGGRQLVIVGDAGHAEVVGAVGAVGGKCLVVSGADDARLGGVHGTAGVVAQTTMAPARLAAVAGRLRELGVDTVEIDTVCPATRQLQESARRLARRCDLVIVVGGSASANTGRLVDACRAEGSRAERAACAGEVVPEWFAGMGRIGVTAGASTPDRVAQAVVRRAEELLAGVRALAVQIDSVFARG